jgi:phage shock protein C
MRKLHLSQTNKKIFGVIGGAGETYDIDPTLLRLAIVFIALATAIVPALLTYLIAWLIIPENTMTRVEESGGII